MTTESVHRPYLNGTKRRTGKTTAKARPSKLDTDLEIFALREEQEGLRPSVIKVHTGMIRTSLAVIAEKHEVDHKQITRTDLKFVEETLTARGYEWPISYARILAKFVSVVTRKAPLIPLGKLEFKVDGDALLVTRTKTLGTSADRRRIMSEHGKNITAFLDAMKGVNFAQKSEKSLCAAIFVFEKVNGQFDPGTVTLEDIEAMKGFLKDFGTPNPSKYAALMVRFVAFVTREPPLREIHSRVPKDDWMAGLPEKCPFTKEMTAYAKLLDRRNIGMSSRKTMLTRARIFGAMLDIRFGVKDLNDVEPEMLDAVCEDIATHVSPTTARAFRRSFLNFCSYFGRDDLREYAISLAGRKPFIPSDELDAAFMEKLDGWVDYLIQWEYSGHTIRERTSAVRICYGKMKHIKGPFDLASLEPFDMQNLRNAFIGYHQSTVQSYLQTFGWFLKFATGRNVYDEAHLWFNGEVIQRNFVTMDEFRKLWQAGGPVEHMILALGGTMGIRKNEMIGLELSDFEGDTVRIRGKGAGPEGKVVVMEITELVRSTLEEYIPYRAGLLAYGDRSDGKLLVNPHTRDLGRPMSARCHQTILRKLSEKTGIYFTAHGLRRMYAMNMHYAGVDLDTIRRMMRHASVDTTLRCYLKADPRKMQNAISSVNSAFSALDLNLGTNRFRRAGTESQNEQESAKDAIFRAFFADSPTRVSFFY